MSFLDAEHSLNLIDLIERECRYFINRFSEEDLARALVNLHRRLAKVHTDRDRREYHLALADAYEVAWWVIRLDRAEEPEPPPGPVNAT